MWRLRGPGVISRSICKLHDAAICMIGHFTRDRQITGVDVHCYYVGSLFLTGLGHFTPLPSFSGNVLRTLLIRIVDFSKFLSVRNYTIFVGSGEE